MLKITEVRTPQQEKAFLQLQVDLYKDVPNWIRPLDKDIKEVFDPGINKFFRHGTCTRWILEDGTGKVIGRVAAFVDEKTVHKGNDQPTGGIGFFDCINDREAAFMLFDTCKNWLKDRGMEAMDGPINFGNRDRWWGLLIDGFDKEPNYCINYNFPYYQELFEAYGFQVYFYQYTFGRPIEGPISDRMLHKNLLISKKGGYHFEFVKSLDLDRISEEIVQVYNKAWANRKEIPPITKKQTFHLLKKMKPILDKHLIWFGYYKGEPIAFFISIPEVNQIYKYLNGRFDLMAKLKLLWHVRMKTCRKAFGLLFGVVPEHQGKGVDGAIISEFKEVVQKKYNRYDTYELGWIGDFNPKMIKVAEQIDAKVVKTHATYRKLFDESKPFRRMPIIN